MSEIKLKKNRKYKYEIIVDKERTKPDELFHIKNFICCVIGPPGSGKTMTIVNLLKSKKIPILYEI